jgi:DDE_Tnp_1-associated
LDSPPLQCLTPWPATFTIRRVAVTPFAAFLDLIGQIEDPRRAEGKLYRLAHVVLFAILASLAGANSYRTVETFIDVHLKQLRRRFGLTWRRAPAHTTIRWILQQLDPQSVESVLRRHAGALAQAAHGSGHHVAIDGKTLRGSFDNFEDRKAAHVLSAFASGLTLTLAHLDCGEKSNEIPAVQELIAVLGLPGSLLTVDAMHCQKKPSTRRARPATTSSPN